MAKVTSLITLRGTFDGLTFVKSPTYGDHVRAARGTRKKAELNAACQEQSKKLVKSNVPAKIIKGAINPYRKDFYHGQLWQKLVSLTNDLLENDAVFDFSRLEPFEIHIKYPLDRFGNITTDTAVDPTLSKLRVTVTFDRPPLFDECVPVDGFRVGVIAIYPDMEKQSAKTEAAYSNIYGLTEKVEPLKMEFPIPSGAKSFLVCVRVDGCENGQVSESLAAKGMGMVEAGRV